MIKRVIIEFNRVINHEWTDPPNGKQFKDNRQEQVFFWNDRLEMTLFMEIKESHYGFVLNK